MSLSDLSTRRRPSAAGAVVPVALFGLASIASLPVEIGDSAGEMIAVTGALEEGDRVAIRGAENLSEGADVRIMVYRSESGGIDTNVTSEEG